MPASHYPFFVKRDLDGLFGLLIDNLVQLLMIVAMCRMHCGMTGENAKYLLAYILPGAAVSILVGNLFYAWQARRLAFRTGRSDVTALPYGLNTPSVIVYIFFVMKPVYDDTHSAELAWKMGLLACLGSGLIEFFGSFVAESIRRSTPRAALLSTLAGISIGFISMQFALQIFHKPLLAMLPLAIILITLFARVPFPLGLPGGLVAILLGTACAWFLPHQWTLAEVNVADVHKAWEARGWHWPILCFEPLREILQTPGQWLKYLSVIVPMGLFNVVGSLQNIESAEASGDSYNTSTSLAANGVGTLSAALFGSCFPTTIYIGHPGWKALGARSGYSTVNGLIITLICLSGTVSLISAVVPIEAGVAIVLWVGVIITAQAFRATPEEHAPAVAIGLFPAIGAWGLTIVQGAFIMARGFSPDANGITMQQLLQSNFSTEINGFLLHGLIVVERGSIFSCMILAAISALLIDRKLFSAGVWSLLAAGFTFLGLMHAYQLHGNTIDFLLQGMSRLKEAPAAGATATPAGLEYSAMPIAVGYLLFATAFFAAGLFLKRNPDAEAKGH